MKVIDDAKQGRSKSVIEAVQNGRVTNLQVLLQKVCQDDHSIKKHGGHLEPGTSTPAAENDLNVQRD